MLVHPLLSLLLLSPPLFSFPSCSSSRSPLVSSSRFSLFSNPFSLPSGLYSCCFLSFLCYLLSLFNPLPFCARTSFALSCLFPLFSFPSCSSSRSPLVLLPSPLVSPLEALVFLSLPFALPAWVLLFSSAVSLFSFPSCLLPSPLVSPLVAFVLLSLPFALSAWVLLFSSAVSLFLFLSCSLAFPACLSSRGPRPLVSFFCPSRSGGAPLFFRRFALLLPLSLLSSAPARRFLHLSSGPLFAPPLSVGVRALRTAVSVAQTTSA